MDMGILAFDIRLRPNLSAGDYSFYRPDSQYDKGQYVQYSNLTQVENAFKVNIKIEWHSNYDDYQGSDYYLITVWYKFVFYRYGVIVSFLRHF